MKSTHIYVLAGVFGILLVFVLLLEGPLKPKPAIKTEAILPNFNPATVARLEISRKEEKADDPESPPQEKKVILDKSSGQWLVQTSEGYPADRKKVDDALEKLKSLAEAEIVSKNPENHPEMEVDEEKGTLLKIIGANESPIAEIFIGKAGPHWSSSYVRKKGADNTVLAKEGLHNTFTADSKDWLNKEISRFELKNLSKVTTKYESTEFTIEQPTENEWKITSPAELPCDKNIASSIARTLSNLSLSDVAPKKELSEYGLDNPQFTITVEVKDTSPRIIYIGKEKEDTEEYYAKRHDSDFIVLIRKYAVKSIAKKLEDVVDKAVLEFDTNELTGISLTLLGTEVTLKRDEQQAWIMEAPYKSPVETSTIDYVTKTLSTLSASSVLIDSDPKETGLESPGTTIALSFKDETKNKKLLIGSLKEDADYHARIEGVNVTYLISKHFIEGISQKSPVDFVSRDVCRFDVNEVSGISITYPENSLSLRKEGTTWRIVPTEEGAEIPSEEQPPSPSETESPPEESLQPAPPEVNSTTVNQVLATLSALRASSISDVTDASECGFDNPALRIAITLTDDRKISLIFGKRKDDGSWFVKREDREIVYLVPDATTVNLLIPLENFVKPEPDKEEAPADTPDYQPLEEKREGEEAAVEIEESAPTEAAVPEEKDEEREADAEEAPVTEEDEEIHSEEKKEER